MRSSLLSLTFISGLLLASCAVDPQEVALEEYLSEVDEIGSAMSEAGTKLETVVNLHADSDPSWSQAEKNEITAVQTSMSDLLERANAMPVPDILVDVHPLLLQSTGKMLESVNGFVTIINDPNKATDAFTQQIESNVTESEVLADEYATALEAAVSDMYPWMVEE